MTESDTVRLSEIFLDVADTLVDDFDLIEFNSRLADHFVTLSPVDQVGILLVDQVASLRVIASSTEHPDVLELYELERDEGPCLLCLHSGEPVVNVDLSQDDPRWPNLATRARQAGFHVAHAIPMRVRDEVIGTVNALAHAPGGISEEELRVARSLAAIASVGILQERAVRENRILAEQLQTALSARVIIEQAKGMVAEGLGTDPEAAWTLLRQYARPNHLTVAEQSRRLLSREISVESLERDR